jgi:hypothetical protein
MKGASVNYNMNGFLSNDPSLVFSRKFYTRMLVVDQGLGFSYLDETLELNLGAGLTYNKMNYEVQHTQSSFMKISWNADLRYRFKKDIILISSAEQFNHAGRTPGFNTSVLLVNMAIAKKMFHGQGEIKLTGYDLLKQDKGISRLVKENYYEDTRYTVTPRFFLLSFLYNFRNKEKSAAMPKSSEMLYFK